MPAADSRSWLVALHLAGESLRTGESEIAIVGGVSLNLAAQSAAATAALGVISPDGRCRAFGAHANGCVRGEGGSVVVLDPLERALANGDRIYCVVLARAVRPGGR